MTTTAAMAAARMALSALAVALLLPSVVAGDATIRAVQHAPGWYSTSAIVLSLKQTPTSPANQFSVAPLTEAVGRNSSDVARDIDIEGVMVHVDQNNFNDINDSGTIAYLSCDSNTADSNINPSFMLNTMTVKPNKPKAIVLYSAEGNCCALEDNDDAYTSIFSFMSKEEAVSARTMADNVRSLSATITSDSNERGSNQPASSGGNNSAVAMSILYSITGLITLLFLVIIATGAVRAHRHPERYGPRPGHGGRARQSRARGLARAVLDTLPIVKFGDPQPIVKGDPEHELESVAGDRSRESTEAPGGLGPTVASEAPANPVVSSVEVQKPVATETREQQPARKDGPIGDEHLGCSICTEDFTVGEDVRVLPCDHKFHPACIDPWLINVSGTCPLCRLDLHPHDAQPSEGEEEEPAPATRPASVPGPEDTPNDGESSQRRRRSRLLDWNRLRHAPVDERIQALRQFRQQHGDSTSGSVDRSVTERLRDKFHIRTRTQQASDGQ